MELERRMAAVLDGNNDEESESVSRTESNASINEEGSEDVPPTYSSNL